MSSVLLHDFIVEEHVKNALKEDIGFGDITTDYLVPKNERIIAKLNTREDGILCGIDIVETVFKTLSNEVKIQKFFKDGDKIRKGDTLAVIEGPARAVLIGERTALNYIQRLSGIATETNKYQVAIGDNKARITDTRKTTPGFRMFEKYAVYTGGARLHRFNLSDCVMIKDNHIQYAGSITNAVNKIREHLSHTHKIEIECDTIEQVKEAINAKADIIMLDNMNCDLMKQCVELIGDKALIEASGNVTIDTIGNIAKTGVDVISSSAIVAKAKTLDIALDM
ncbi:TPA: carboxylating nicotinate-nucleotide diphosphorylase [Candidatus Avigastranaerophilus faecigallinarum]|nr:carboxylating nicotinate-nucleotide diphosphorylase [Candidatus Avigastranaerophilus faecigallinarum]